MAKQIPMSVEYYNHLYCVQCKTPIMDTPHRRMEYRKNPTTYVFCSHSCKTKFSNINNNPMKDPNVRLKLSQSIRKLNKWVGKDNPNYNGKIVSNAWLTGKYKFRDLSKDKNPAWIDGRSYEKYGRGHDWRIQRLKALKRDAFTCQNCKIPDSHVVHHITPYFISHNNSLDNLITLCSTCHGQVHAQFGWQEWKEDRV